MENKTKKFSPRYQSRELSLKVLFSYSQNPRTSIDENFKYMKENFFPKLKKTELSEDILKHYVKDKKKISEVVKEFANRWDIEKQNSIDIVILEMIAVEVIFLWTPWWVVVSEYINLTVEYSKESSVKFINWVTAQIIKKYWKEDEKFTK